MAQTLLRFGEGSYGLRVDEHVYKFRPDETRSFQELTERVSIESLAWYHASSVFPEALPALAVRSGRPVPHFIDETVEVTYDLSQLFWDAVVEYDHAKKETAHWKQAPSLGVTAWVEHNTPVAKTPTDLRAAVQYAACTGKNEYITIDHLRKRERKHVSPTFFTTHVLPKLNGTIVLEEKDGGILVFKANVPRVHESIVEFGTHYKCKIWKSEGQISACWYGH